MAWFEKLEKIIHIHDLINITIVKNEQSKEKLKFLDGNKKIEINTANLNDKELQNVKKKLRKLFDEEKTTFLEKEAKEKIDDIKIKLNLKTTKDVLNFYEDKIPKESLDALEASLYLREAFREGKDITDLKKDIIHRFGLIGKNICNLCSSGYFEGFIKELYLEMSKQPKFSLNSFQHLFNEIVINSPFTVFVNQYRKKSDIKTKINSKLKKFQNYGINYLAVHGIGTENVKMIKETIDELKNERNDIKTEMRLESRSSIIQVKIMFK